jgi:hypothetical protein
MSNIISTPSNLCQHFSLSILRFSVVKNILLLSTKVSTLHGSRLLHLSADDQAEVRSTSAKVSVALIVYAGYKGKPNTQVFACANTGVVRRLAVENFSTSNVLQQGTLTDLIDRLWRSVESE